jgi:hypothetical protein
MDLNGRFGADVTGATEFQHYGHSFFGLSFLPTVLILGSFLVVFLAGTMHALERRGH